MSPITGNLYTLRSADRELLPRATVFLYGTDIRALRRSLDSLGRQTASRFEVMILHDGPLSRTVFDDLDELGFSRPLHLLEIARPCGKARCINIGLSRSQSDFLLALDAGDVLGTSVLARLLNRLQTEESGTLGAYGDLELDRRLLAGDASGSSSRLFNRLARQKQIAPPLLRREPLLLIGGCPADYPGEGWLCADTALALAVLGNGSLAYEPNAVVRRTGASPRLYRKQDERAILNVLIRQASKRLQLPLPF